MSEATTLKQKCPGRPKLEQTSSARITVRLTEEVKQDLIDVAKEKGMSLSDLMRDAVNQVLAEK